MSWGIWVALTSIVLSGLNIGLIWWQIRKDKKENKDEN